MRMRRTERDGDQVIEVFVEDWQENGESWEVFSEKMIRFAERLTMLDTSQPAEAEGD